MEKYNLIVSSKNRDKKEPISNFTVRLEKPLIAYDNEYFTINMVHFHTIKAFYAIQDGLNNHFQIVYRFKDTGIIESVDDIYLFKGNYDVFTLQQHFLSFLAFKDAFSIEYEESTNKYIYTDIRETPTTDVFIKCINSGILLGFDDGEENRIDYAGTYSTKFINVSGYENMMINIGGNIEIENSITNISSSTFKHSSILGILSVSHIIPMDSIIYENTDGGINYNHKVHNKIIDHFTLSITNENGVIFPQMSDYLITLQITKCNKTNDMTAINIKLEDIAILMTATMEKLNIIDMD